MHTYIYIYMPLHASFLKRQCKQTLYNSSTLHTLSHHRLNHSSRPQKRPPTKTPYSMPTLFATVKDLVTYSTLSEPVMRSRRCFGDTGVWSYCGLSDGFLGSTGPGASCWQFLLFFLELQTSTVRTTYGVFLLDHLGCQFACSFPWFFLFRSSPKMETM